MCNFLRLYGKVVGGSVGPYLYLVMHKISLGLAVLSCLVSLDECQYLMYKTKTTNTLLRKYTKGMRQKSVRLLESSYYQDDFHDIHTCSF